MTLPASGRLGLSAINLELGKAATARLSLDDPGYRTLTGIASGRIGLASGYGKSNGFNFNKTISVNTNNYNLKADAIAAGWDQVKVLLANIIVAPGVVIGSSSTSLYALDTGSGFPAGSNLSLNIGTGAYIVGAGGLGAGGGTSFSDIVAAPAGSAGGPALHTQFALSVTNSGTIGGGGGGAGAGSGTVGYNLYFAGGCGGGGAGSSSGAGGASFTFNNGMNAEGVSPMQTIGAGSVGSLTAGGSGSAGYNWDQATGGTGGTGGGLGQAGDSGGGASNGYAAQKSSPVGPGGAAGAAVVGNSLITWNQVGTRLGSIL